MKVQMKVNVQEIDGVKYLCASNGIQMTYLDGKTYDIVMKLGKVIGNFK